MTSDYIAWFEEFGSGDAEVGGKNASLGEMAGAFGISPRDAIEGTMRDRTEAMTEGRASLRNSGAGVENPSPAAISLRETARSRGAR